MQRDERTLGRLPPGTFPLGDLSPREIKKAIQCIDSHFGRPGTPFEIICAARGGMRHYDLEIPLEDGIHACCLRMAHANSFLLLEGFFAMKFPGHIRHREAASEGWDYPMAA